MENAAKSGAVIPFPNGGVKAAAHEQKMSKKAYDAFHNARQRCTNPKSPSYPGYGAKGVSFLYASFAEFLDDVGLPEKAQVTLDRIDPAGNYEPGNVRWANSHVQAANKKGAKFGASLTTAALIDASKAVSERWAKRRAAAKLWAMMISAIRRGRFTSADAEIATKLNLLPSALDAGWDLGQEPDLAEPPSYFHLPSLTVPGQVVRLLGGPFKPVGGDEGAGVLPGLGRIGPEQALPKSILNSLPASLLGFQGVSIFIGAATPELLRRGGVEGLFLYLASRLRHGPAPKFAVFMPMLDVLAELDALGPLWKWDETKSVVLDARWLFVPDVQIASGGYEQLKPFQWGRFSDLIRYRRERGFSSYLGVHNLNGVPKTFISELLSASRIVEVPPIIAGADHLSQAVATGPLKGVPGFNALRKTLLAK